MFREREFKKTFDMKAGARDRRQTNISIRNNHREAQLLKRRMAVQDDGSIKLSLSLSLSFVFLSSLLPLSSTLSNSYSI